MKLQKRIAVEPLDDERITNIERRLVVSVSSVRQAHAPRRPLAFVTAGLAAAVVVLIAWTWHRPLATTQPAVAAVDPAPAQHVSVTTEAERSTLALDDATIASDPSTTFDVTRGPGRVVVEMLRGRLELAVKHRTDRVLVIHVGDTEIEDVGTRFSVAYDGATIDVRVTEGEVRVTRDHHETDVGAGSAWTSTRGLVALAALEAPTPRTPTPTLVAAHAAHLARATIAHAPPRPRVADAAVPMPNHAAAPVDPYVDLRTAIRALPIAFDPKIDGRTDAANEIARLKLLAYSPTTVGDEASTALYRIAVLLHRPLGQDAAALNTLELYRRRFTTGKERTAAMWLRVRIACGHTIDEECRSAAYSYQREAPAADGVDVAIRITNSQ